MAVDFMPLILTCGEEFGGRGKTNLCQKMISKGISSEAGRILYYCTYININRIAEKYRRTLRAVLTNVNSLKIKERITKIDFGLRY